MQKVTWGIKTVWHWLDSTTVETDEYVCGQERVTKTEESQLLKIGTVQCHGCKQFENKHPEKFKKHNKDKEFKLTIFTSAGTNTTLQTSKQVKEELQALGETLEKGLSISNEKIVLIIEPSEEKIDTELAEKLVSGLQKVLDEAKVVLDEKP